MPLQGNTNVAVPVGAGGDIPALDVPLLEQVGDEWCWAACAQMILIYYHGLPAVLEDVAQCRIAEVLFEENCCNPPGCDEKVPSSAVTVLYDRLDLAALRLPQVADFDVLVDEIAAGRPVQVGLQREDGTAHLVLVIGAALRNGHPWVRFNDPDGAQAGSSSYAALLASGAVESWIGIKEN